MTVALQELDLKYPSLKRYWKVEVLTNHFITPEPYPRPPVMYFNFGSGHKHGGYRICVDSTNVYLWGGVFFDQETGQVTREDHWAMLPEHLQVGKSKMFCDDSNGLVVVKFTRVS